MKKIAFLIITGLVVSLPNVGSCATSFAEGKVQSSEKVQTHGCHGQIPQKEEKNIPIQDEHPSIPTASCCIDKVVVSPISLEAGRRTIIPLIPSYIQEKNSSLDFYSQCSFFTFSKKNSTSPPKYIYVGSTIKKE